MTVSYIRAISLGVFLRHDQELLVFEGHHPDDGQPYYRPLGGGIHFGETAAAALEREIQEEIGTAIQIIKPLGTLENIFTNRTPPGHEIVWLYEATLLESALYECHESVGYEDDGTPFRVLWKPLKDFYQGAILYPQGLLELLQNKR